jgi:hypothetical protein
LPIVEFGRVGAVIFVGVDIGLPGAVVVGKRQRYRVDDDVALAEAEKPPTLAMKPITDLPSPMNLADRLVLLVVDVDADVLRIDDIGVLDLSRRMNVAKRTLRQLNSVERLGTRLNMLHYGANLGRAANGCHAPGRTVLRLIERRVGVLTRRIC